MAKPNITSNAIQAEIDKANARAKKAEEATQKYQDLISASSITEGSLKKSQNKLKEIELKVKELEGKRKELTEWFNDFQDKKRAELEKELRSRREVLMAEIKDLQEQKSNEEESMRDLLTAQELNQKETQRQAEAIANQLAYTREKQEELKVKEEKVLRAEAGLKAKRTDLNKRAAAIEVREKKLTMREDDVQRQISEALGKKNSGEQAFEKAKNEGQKWLPIQQKVEADKRAVQQERANLKNETARAESKMKDLQKEYEAARANIDALERREKRVNKAIAALKRKGIDIESEL